MVGFKKFVLFISVFLFVLSAALLPGMLAWKLTLGNKANVKNWLNESGFYQNAPDLFINNLGGGEQRGENEFTTSDLKTPLKNTLTPEFLQKGVEKYLDAFYSWLNSKDFNEPLVLDLNEQRDVLANELVKFLEQKLAALPKCGRGNIPPRDTSPLELECLPPGAKVASEVAEFKADITSANGALGNPIVVIKNDGSDNSKNLYLLKRAGRLFNALLPAIAIGFLLFGGLIIWASPERLRGVRKIAVTLLVFGMLGLIGATLVSLTSNSPPPQAKPNDLMQNLAVPVVREAAQDISRLQLIIYSIYSASGIGGLIAYKKFHKSLTKTTKKS